MLLVIIQALYFFLPSYISNAAPVFLDRYKIWESLKKPVDGGRKYKGEFLFGSTKTYRGLIGGTLAGIFVVLLQAILYFWVPDMGFLYLFPYELPNVIFLGFLLGFGEGLGDLIKSFFKRRLHIKSTGPSFPLDQSSFLVALLLSFIYYMISWQHILVILIVSPLIPILSNFIGYKIGWKKVWW